MMRRTLAVFALGAVMLADTAAGLRAQVRTEAGGHMPASRPERWAPVIRFNRSADDLALFATTIGYPPAALANGRRADVVVKVDVDTSGTCSGAVLISGGREFDDSVIAALGRAAFEPGHTPWDSIVPATFGLRVRFRPADTGATTPVTVFEMNPDDAAMWARQQGSASLKHAQSTPASDVAAAPRAPRMRKARGHETIDVDVMVINVPRTVAGQPSARDRSIDTLYPSGVTIPPGGPQYASPDFDLGELRARMKYPEYAKLQGVEGMVYVEARIDRSGALAQARVVHSDNAMLNDAALEAVQATRFRAAHRYGEAVDASVIIPLAFRLK
ncbi:MAG: energy transducer TonB [Bacteroidetes bacterium]|nr:energy transducer TonB [Bacteroidota bacterium]